MNRESLKTGVLAFLFILCVFLASRMFGMMYNDESHAIVSSSQEKNITTMDLLSPQSYYLSFGGGLHTGVYDEKIQSDIWDKTVDIIHAFGPNPKSMKVKRSDWQETIDSKSVIMRMPKGLKMKDMLSAAYPDDSAGSKIMRDMSVDTIAIRLTKPFAIYFADEKTGDFRKIETGDEYSLDHAADSLIRVSDIVEKGVYTEFRSVESVYSIRSILGKGKDDFVSNTNDIPIVPLDGIRPVEVVDIYKYQASVKDSEGQKYASEVRKIAAAIFGGDLSFVKKLTDIDGSTTYIYGYGEKSLKLSRYGVFEYKLGNTSYQNVGKASFAYCLGRVSDIMSAIFKDRGNVVLDSYEETSKGASVIRKFSLSPKISGLTFRLGESPLESPIVLEFTGTELSSLSIDAVSLKSVSADAAQGISFQEIMSKNIEKLIKDNPKKDDTIDDMDYPYEVINSIDRISLIYAGDAKGTNGSGMISAMPVWVMEIGEQRYVIDFYTGDILNERIN